MAEEGETRGDWGELGGLPLLVVVVVVEGETGGDRGELGGTGGGRGFWGKGKRSPWARAGTGRPAGTLFMFGAELHITFVPTEEVLSCVLKGAVVHPKLKGVAHRAVQLYTWKVEAQTWCQVNSRLPRYQN